MRWYTTTLLCAPALASAQFPNTPEDRAPTVTSENPNPIDPARPGSWSSFWWGDSDGDGLADAFVIQSSGEACLLRNRGDGTFEDVTACSGLTDVEAVHMALWSDLDGDGRQDLFLPSYRGASHLLRQDESGVFEEITESAGLDPSLSPIDAEWLDYDEDGRPDLLVTTLGDERLYHNLGSALFECIDLGLEPRPQRPLAASPAPARVDDARATRGLPPVMPRSPKPPGGGRIPVTGPPGMSVRPVNPPPAATTSSGFCAPHLIDQSNPLGNCISASNVPLLGMLYPLSHELFVDGGTGYVGMGTTSPVYRLDVLGGDIRTDAQLISTATSGPPLSVQSSVRVPNLNADLLDGLHASTFSQLGSSIEGTEITDSTIGAADLAPNSVGASEIASNAVGSAELVASSISNAHVSGSAAIAGTKVNPDFGGQSVHTSSQLVSTTTTQPPLSVSSSWRVPNLNADLIDGVDSSVFSQLGNSIEGSEITNGTIGPEDLDWPLYGSTTSRLLWAQTTGSGGTAIEGNTVAGSGFGRGVKGTANSVSGVGVEGLALAATGATYGVHGRSDSSGGTGVLAEAPSTSGTTYGVQGLVISPDGTGVLGKALGTTGTTYGVHGESLSNAGVGVRGEGNSLGVHGTGFLGVKGDSTGYGAAGVFGYCSGFVGQGVLGMAAADGDSFDGSLSAGVMGQSDNFGYYTTGVYGDTMSAYGYGLYARAWSDIGGAKGVYAQTDASSGDGVYGKAIHTTGAAWGVRGETASPYGYGVHCSGNFLATGSKNFVQPHPEDPGQEIHFVCLEGNESGTYFRGSSRVVNGTAVIAVPEEFRLASSPEGLTAMITVVGSPARLWVQSKSLDEIVVHGDSDADFDYFINGVRRGYEEHQPIRQNQNFVPGTRGVEFGTQYPEALRQVLVENGTLNPDFTPDEATAAAQGWILGDPPVGRDKDAPAQSGPSPKPALDLEAVEAD